MSTRAPWLADRMASLVPNVLLPTQAAAACLAPSDRRYSETHCSSGNETCPGGCCTMCYELSCYGRHVTRSWMCGPC
jgi:hypothetical protein